MKPYQYGIEIINAILFLFFCWLLWVGEIHLPGQLDSVMQRDVMLQKYQNVCAYLAASMAIICLVVIVLVNAVLLTVYFLLKKSMVSTASSNKTIQGTL